MNTEPSTPASHPASRVLALDTFRGVIMVGLMFEGAVPAWSEHLLPGSSIAAWVGLQFQHVAWAGCRLWDLGQPAFIFMSGMAIPYAIASRRGRGASGFSISMGVLRRSLILIGLGLLIRSDRVGYTDFNFVHDVLLQIGLAAPFAVLIATRAVRTQIALAVAILAGYWLLFAMHPVPTDVALASAGLPADWTHYTGFFAHWDRTGNFAADFDRWFLNLFPRPEPFVNDELGLATLNFVPSIVTMVAGALAGQLLKTSLPPAEKVKRLAVAALVCLATGWLLGQTICPIVKPLWTPSWTIFSAGWVLVGLLALYWTIDVRRYRGWTYAFLVLGTNALFVYVMFRLLAPWIWATLSKHLGPMSYTLELFMVIAIIWMAAAWLYKRRVIMTA